MNNIILALSCIFAIGSCIEEDSRFDHKYCSIHPFHVLCVYEEKGINCLEPFTKIILNEEQQREILDWHNRMRQRIALGIEKRGFAGPQPFAANMMKMDWDPELARIAQRTANQCVAYNDCEECIQVLGGRFKVGQNIVHRIVTPITELEIDFATVFKNFYEKEVGLFNANRVKSYIADFFYGHYTQIVWWNTRLIGCGGATYGAPRSANTGNYILVCNYGPAGNIPFKKVYAIGTACSQCPQGTSCDSHYHGLCAITKSPFNVQDEFPTDKMQLDDK